MKRVAVLVPSFTIEYCYSLLQGVTDYFKDKDVQLIILQTKYGKYSINPIDCQYWAGMNLIDIDDIDIIIVFSGAYCSIIPESDFINILKNSTSKPIISIAVDLKLPNSYSIRINCKNIYNEIVHHLKKIHHCKKIAFLSAVGTGSPEAKERFEFFKEALKNNGLTFYSDLVYEGQFTIAGGESAIRERFEKAEDVNFDAIVSSNDYMAIGAISVLKELNVKIPKDVKVIGFDDALITRYSAPKLSTVNQDFFEEGYKTARIAEQIINGVKVDKNIYNDLVIKYRQSCGCIKESNLSEIYKNECRKTCKENQIANSFENYLTSLDEKNKLMRLIDILRSSNTLRQFHFKMKSIIEQCEMSEMYVYLYKEPVYADYERKFTFPDTIELYMYDNENTNKREFRPGVYVNTKDLLTSCCNQEKGNFIVQPIFSGEMNYGFISCKMKNTKFANYEVYLKILFKDISQAYEYTDKIIQTEKIMAEKNSLMEKNIDLQLQTHTDELTKILNRRGFLDIGQKNLDIMQELNTEGYIFFADMDGLKAINDKYGHSVGDKAIKLQASVLKTVFNEKDIVGRLSGDEFGIVALYFDISNFENLKQRIDEENKRISKEKNLPFVLSISLGYADLSLSTDLKILLKEADKNLYKEKQIKHMNRRLDIHYE